MSQLLHVVSKIELKGNQQQVKWAKQIRGKKLAEIDKMRPNEFALGMKPALTDELLKAIKCDTPSKFNTLMWLVKKSMFEADDAVWWIGKRDEAAWTWIVPKTKDMVERCAQSKTFK